MSRRLAVFVVAASLVSGLAGPAFAQSVGAPAGRDPATAPGGTEGIAGPRNQAEAEKSGDAIAVPPGRSGIPAEDAPTTRPGMPPEAPPAPPAPPRP